MDPVEDVSVRDLVPDGVHVRAEGRVSDVVESVPRQLAASP